MNDSTEERLRSALRARADLVQTDGRGGLEHIRRRSARIRTRRRAVVGGTAVAFVAVAAVLLPRLGEDSDDVNTLPADESTTTSTDGASQTSTTVVADERTVSVYWVDADGDLRPADRTVPLSDGVLRGAVQQLLLGPSSDERDDGLSSALDSAAASATFDVTITDGHAVIDFGDDLPSLSPGTSSAAASEAFLRQLHATVFQFDTVTEAEFIVRDSCDFWNWLQRGCTTVTRDDPGV